jgi:hypothetical protein
MIDYEINENKKDTTSSDISVKGEESLPGSATKESTTENIRNLQKQA